jgi:hypothetical protein
MTNAKKSQVGRESDKFMLRLPDGMRDRIAEVAKQNGRSMNAEIVARLQRSIEVGTSLSQPRALDMMTMVAQITAEAAKVGIQVKIEFARSPESILEAAKGSGHLPPDATLADLAGGAKPAPPIESAPAKTPAKRLTRTPPKRS